MGMHWIGLIDVEGLKLGIGSDGGAWGRADQLHEVKVAKALGKAMSVSVTYFKAGLDSNTLLKMLTGSAGPWWARELGDLRKVSLQT